jgi:hypothetical protein
MENLEFGAIHPNGSRNISFASSGGEIRKPSKAQKKRFESRTKIQKILEEIEQKNDLKEVWDE